MKKVIFKDNEEVYEVEDKVLVKKINELEDVQIGQTVQVKHIFNLTLILERKSATKTEWELMKLERV